MNDTRYRYTGSCLCGAVRYGVAGPMSDVHACHCGQCRRQSGHYTVAASADQADFSLIEASGLKWYQSSPEARRGFCGECGSVLFWDNGSDQISINAGNLDGPTGLTLKRHIYVDFKGDYYRIADGMPQFAGYDTPIGGGETAE